MLKFASFETNDDMLTFIHSKIVMNRSITITKIVRDGSKESSLFSWDRPYLLYTSETKFVDVDMNPYAVSIINSMMNHGIVALNENKDSNKFIIMTDTVGLINRLLNERYTTKNIPTVDDMITTLNILKENYCCQKSTIEFNRITSIFYSMRQRETEMFREQETKE